jgi:hypothetical protein
MRDLQINRSKRERGQSLAEFALGITFILILMAGVVDLGRAYFSFLSLRDAAQEGALYGSLSPPDTDGIRARVRDSSGWPIDFSTFTDSQIQVNVSGPACAGSEIKVTLQMDFMLAAPFIGGKALPLGAEATDTILQPPC